MSEPSLAARFADAMAHKDHAHMLGLLHPAVDFHAMTPKRVWEATTPQEVVDVFTMWFGEHDVIEGVEWVQTAAFADRERAGYRLRVRNNQGLHLIEQQAYLSDRDGQIGWLRILCSGYRPAE